MWTCSAFHDAGNSIYIYIRDGVSHGSSDSLGIIAESWIVHSFLLLAVITGSTLNIRYEDIVCNGVYT